MATIGDSVIDGFKPTLNWVERGIEFVEDVAEFHKERAAIERDAAAKLAALASKFHSKKASVSSAVSVGEHPVTTPGSLESGSMEAWTTVLNEAEQMAAHRKQFATDLHGVSEQLQQVQQRFGEVARQFEKLDERLEEQREQQTKQLKKAKSAYDASCEQLESARAKGKKSVEAKESEMRNLKNQYIVQINVSNRLKDKFYHDDLPELLDAFQRAAMARVAQTNSIVAAALSGEQSLLERLGNSLKTAESAVAANGSERDVQMFVEHNANVAQFVDPPDFLFEPSPIWHDNEDMSVDAPASVQFLAGLLGDARRRSVPAAEESERAMQVYEGARRGVEDADFGAIASVQAAALLKTSVKALEQLVLAETQRLAVEVEIEAIEAGTAGVDMSHVPQTRVKVHRSIFGRKKTEVVEVGESAPASRALGLSSLLSRARSVASAPHSGTAAGGGAGGSGSGSGATRAQILYDFAAGNDAELSVAAGDSLELLRGDDGSGWVLLQGAAGRSGLVPATYVEILFGGKKPAPPPARGSARTATALYDFEGQDSSQLSLRAGDIITITGADEGGWSRGSVGGVNGLFPTAYARIE